MQPTLPRLRSAYAGPSCLALATAIFGCVGGTAVAQPADAFRDEVAAILDAAIADQRIILNCYATVPRAWEVAARVWPEDVEGSALWLADHGFDAKFIDSFRARASLDTLVMSDVPFSEAIVFCNADPEWETRYFQFRITLLPFALERLDEEAP